MKIRKISSCIIVTAIFTFFSVLAIYTTPVGATSTQVDTNELIQSNVAPTVVSEETSLRDVNSKHF